MTERKEPDAGGDEALALIGMLFVAAGVFLSLGAGPALVVAGAMMLATAIVLAISRARAGRM